MRVSRDGIFGSIIEEDEEADGCDLEGCRGYAILVKWDNGTRTTVCSQSLRYDAESSSAAS